MELALYYSVVWNVCVLMWNIIILSGRVQAVNVHHKV